MTVDHVRRPKPFEPINQVLYHVADEYLDEDWYMSSGKYRRLWKEENRKNRIANRKRFKFIRMMLKKLGMVPLSIQAARTAQIESH